MTTAHRATVAVLGGGPAGASAALELARLGIDTLLIEQTDGSGNPIGECLAPSANPLLRALGLEDVLRQTNALPSYGNRSRWGNGGTLDERGFLRDPHGHGWHLDRPAFNRALLDRVEAAGVSVLRNHRVSAIERVTGGWRLVAIPLEGRSIIEAAMLIDASGRRALVARHERLRRRTVDSQIAAVALLQPEPDSLPLFDATTTIEAVENGWWYSALLPDKRLAVTWFTDADLLATQAAWDPVAWWALLLDCKLIGPLVAKHNYQPPRHIDRVSAGSSVLVNPSGDDRIAAGDAAACYDPLSSHGIGSALAGGRSAASALVAHVNGDSAAFPAYRDRLLGGFTRYLATRHAYYAAEQRWPNAPFWQRRHGNT